MAPRPLARSPPALLVEFRPSARSPGRERCGVARDPRAQDQFLGSGFTTRQLTAIAVAFALAIVLVPVGAKAAALINTVITDPGGTNKAQVDASGHLQVAGQVTVNSSTPVAITSADDPSRMAFQHQEVLEWNPGQDLAQAHVDVPQGKRLVITFVSGRVELPTGQNPQTLSVVTQAGGFAIRWFVPTFLGSDGGDAFGFSQDAVIYADSSFTFSMARDSTVDSAGGLVEVSGCLIDCSGHSCN